MLKYYFTTILSLWLSFASLLCADSGPGRPPDVTGTPAGHAASTRQKRIYIVRNDETKSSKNATVDGTDKTDGSTIKPKAPAKQKPLKKTDKQLQPYVPSETVPADQGVDFPYDI